VARKVAEAGIKSGVAGKIITDFDKYEQEVIARIKKSTSA
jgi:malic enzyme